jgi:hypothetical protein
VTIHHACSIRKGKIWNSSQNLCGWPDNSWSLLWGTLLGNGKWSLNDSNCIKSIAYIASFLSKLYVFFQSRHFFKPIEPMISPVIEGSWPLLNRISSILDLQIYWTGVTWKYEGNYQASAQGCVLITLHLPFCFYTCYINNSFKSCVHLSSTTRLIEFLHLFIGFPLAIEKFKDFLSFMWVRSFNLL